MRLLLVALLTVAACGKTKPAEPPVPRAASDPPIKRLSPQEVKAKVEGAQQQHEERMDKRFDEAQKQGE
jgi:hypothetical protein